MGNTQDLVPSLALNPDSPTAKPELLSVTGSGSTATYLVTHAGGGDETASAHVSAQSSSSKDSGSPLPATASRCKRNITETKVQQVFHFKLWTRSID